MLEELPREPALSYRADMGRHSEDVPTDHSWWPGSKFALRWIATRLLIAALVITAIVLINLIPGVHIPDWDEWHGY